MIEKIKTKIKDSWIWLKAKTKAILIILGIVGVAMAAPQVIPQNTIIIYKDVKELPVEERQGKYIAVERNFNNIQFEKLRRQIDWMYNQTHDALSQAYYEEKEFIWKGKNYGILDKETFDKLQGMIWARYEIMFHEENMKQNTKDRINENEYNDILDENNNVIGKKSEKAKDKIEELKKQNIDIDL